MYLTRFMNNKKKSSIYRSRIRDWKLKEQVVLQFPDQLRATISLLMEGYFHDVEGNFLISMYIQVHSRRSIYQYYEIIDNQFSRVSNSPKRFVPHFTFSTQMDWDSSLKPLLSLTLTNRVTITKNDVGYWRSSCLMYCD